MKVYTYNDKVLTNSANGKWLKEKEAPAGFVMNASNAHHVRYNNGTPEAIWNGPDYPNGWDGSGLTLKLIVSADIQLKSSTGMQIMYAQGDNVGGPDLVNMIYGDTNRVLHAGTYNLTCLANAAGTASGYGAQISLVNYTDAGSDGYLDDLSKITLIIEGV